MVRGIVFSHSWEVVMRSLCQPTLCLLVVCDWAQSVCINYMFLNILCFLGWKSWVIDGLSAILCCLYELGFVCVDLLAAFLVWVVCLPIIVVEGSGLCWVMTIYSLFFFTTSLFIHGLVVFFTHFLIRFPSLMEISLAWELMPYVLTRLCWAMCSVWTFSVL